MEKKNYSQESDISFNGEEHHRKSKSSIQGNKTKDKDQLYELDSKNEPLLTQKERRTKDVKLNPDQPSVLRPIIEPIQRVTNNPETSQFGVHTQNSSLPFDHSNYLSESPENQSQKGESLIEIPGEKSITKENVSQDKSNNKNSSSGQFIDQKFSAGSLEEKKSSDLGGSNQSGQKQEDVNVENTTLQLSKIDFNDSASFNSQLVNHSMNISKVENQSINPNTSYNQDSSLKNDFQSFLFLQKGQSQEQSRKNSSNKSEQCQSPRSSVKLQSQFNSSSNSENEQPTEEEKKIQDEIDKAMAKVQELTRQLKQAQQSKKISKKFQEQENSKKISQNKNNNIRY